MYHTVYALQLHIENHQQVTYNNKDNLCNIIGNESTRRTMLIDFFEMNKFNEFAPNIIISKFSNTFCTECKLKKNRQLKSNILLSEEL